MIDYEDLILMIYNRKGLSEQNYIYTKKDFEEKYPEFKDIIVSKTGWNTHYIYPNKTISIKQCEGIQDFNNFVSGNYNDCPDTKEFYYENMFYSDDNEDLVCKDFFSEQNIHVYQLK